jgi:hypothetical protein
VFNQVRTNIVLRFPEKKSKISLRFSVVWFYSV